MWTRAELKSNAKAALRSYYWWGLLVCFIASLLGAGGSGSSGGIISNLTQLSENTTDEAAQKIIVMFIYCAIVFIVVIKPLFMIFVSNVVTVGQLGFYIESRYQGRAAGVGRLFFGFSRGKYGNIVKVMFLKGLFEILWTLLLVVPGIIKSYEYYMVPYLLAENPSLDGREAFQMSKAMMDGNKFDTFVLGLSFIGWYLLGTLACCVGIFFVWPYTIATSVELYFKLKQKIFGTAPQDPVYVDQNGYVNI